jgi:hypothetical protein
MDLTHGKPAWSQIAPLLLGPTGNLRAPVIRTGRTLIIGFHDPTYDELLG